jgi:hypothetical protein
MASFCRNASLIILKSVIDSSTMEIGNIIASAATGVGLVLHLSACALFEYHCKFCVLFFQTKITAEVPKTFIEYLMIFNVKPM